MRTILLLLFTVLLNCPLTSNAQQTEHRIQRGETFASIAKKYAITEQELKEANPASSSCYVGRKLIIPKHGIPVERTDAKQPEFNLKSSDKQVLTKTATAAYQTGMALWNKGKQDEAKAYLQAAADGGDKRAVAKLASIKAEEEAKAQAEARARAEAQAKAEEEARALAQARAEQQARQEAERKTMAQQTEPITNSYSTTSTGTVSSGTGSTLETIGNIAGAVTQMLQGINSVVSGSSTTTATGIYGGATSGMDTYSGYSNSTSSSSSNKRSKTVIDEKCPYCLGSGKCETYKNTHVSVKYYCHGNKYCKYCLGAGTITNFGQTTVCAACNGSKRCKYCNGTGKCHYCNGTGKK
jgi:LysM repeat protein